MTDSSTPSVTVDLEAIQAVKTGLSTSIPPGYSLLYSSKQDATFAQAGLDANAYVNEATGQILLAFRGPISIPFGVNPASTLENAALKIDLRIANDDPTVTSSMSVDAARFVSAVSAAAQQKGLSFSSSNVFVTGNSEGGLFAELAARANGFAGATFGAPGIPHRR
ncbi:hypothetical protein [Bradyrhizobium sp.]|uniref:hypothetical protein n=1 Tax=Bradyrhizobium sp. TaxID=376 RepID=UPI001EB4A68A|nr:hypothetical protein [Bradyrhizobium sp.]MBV9481002.1 hypothetical protein [Acidobacteriota bacterium]MBV9978391.1 hypothetical protein [Bradyrhizobium sp.]